MTNVVIHYWTKHGIACGSKVAKLRASTEVEHVNCTRCFGTIAYQKAAMKRRVRLR